MVKSTLIGLLLLGVLAQSALGAGSDWQRVSTFEVAPRSAQIVLVQQRGADLALQVKSQLLSKSPRGVLEQEGPDQAYGTEVVLLENDSASRVRYELSVRTVLNGTTLRYEIERIENPAMSDRAIARAVSAVSQKWLSGAPARDITPLIDQVAAWPAGKLRTIAMNTYADVLIRSGQSIDAIELLRRESAAITYPRLPLADRVYHDYQLANALWDSLQAQPALETAEGLAKDVAASREWRGEVPAPVRSWMDVSIATSLGAIRVFAGRARGDRKLMDRGGALIEATLTAIENEPDAFLRARLTEYLAGYYNFILDRSNPIPADLYRRAAELYEQAGDRVSLAAVRNNQAYAELGRGNLEAALRLYLETVELQKASRNVEGNAYTRARLGYLYYTIGDYRRAEVRLRESIELYEDIKLPLKLIHNQLQLAEVMHADDRPAQAAALLEQTQATYARHLSIEDRLRLTTQLATLRLDQGDVKAAERLINGLAPLERFESSRWNELQTSIRLFHLLAFEAVRASIELANGQLALARRRTERALSWLGDSQREPLRQLQLLHLQLVILERENDGKRFVQVSERALALIESIRGSIDFHTQGPAWSARTSDINDLLVSHYLARYTQSGRRADFDQAFALLEAARARNLRDMRAARIESDAASERAAREVQRANQALMSALLLEQSSEALARRLAKAEEQYQIERAGARIVRAPLAVVDAASIQKHLDAQTQVRILFAGESASYVLILTRGTVDVAPLPREAELKALVAASLEELAMRGSALTRSRQLARLLFPTAGRAMPSRILVESDGVFAPIPYSILLDLQSGDAPRPAVTVVPSLSELLSGSSDVGLAGPRKDLVVFADPAFVLNPQISGYSEWRAGFARLPYSQVEAKSIAAYFDRDAVLTFSDRNATIGNITSETARSARVLHIAAHGFGSASDPFLVGLGLANESEHNASGLLTTQHIRSLRYDNELIVVSACDSGQGKLLDGEGLMSVARAFLASGAKATLSTLWPVPDRANAEFMKEFYFALTRLRTDPAAALVHAQQKMKSSRQFGHPYYWGSFVLHVVDAGYRPVVQRE